MKRGLLDSMADVKILLVDDEENILNIFRMVLESNGYKVDTASTAAEALEKARSTTYQVCLLDINLPDMHGTELLKLMQQVDPSMKKLMVTGDWSPRDVELARKNGADEFVAKPLSKAALLEAVESVLRPT
jgi:DNA-binding NtrC family response regulator